MKICSKCKEYKELICFYKNAQCKDGHGSYCKECYVSINKHWRANNKKRSKELQQNRDKEAARKYQKQNYQRNGETIRAKSREYYQQNKDKIKEYYISNRHQINNKNNIWQKKRRASDPLFKLRNNINNSINRALNQFGYGKKSKINTIIGCSFEQLKTHLIMTFELNYSIKWSDDYSTCVDVDHIYPVSKATSEQQLVDLNHYSNLQYLFRSDNISKSNNTYFIL